MQLKRLTHERKLSGRLYDHLEGFILDGTLSAGDRLPTEAELCQHLGVSRSSLREALQQLKGRGLVESTAGRGMFVRSIEAGRIEKDLTLFAQVEQDPEAFFELVSFRLLIEPENARIAAHKCTSECIRDLESLLNKMHATLEDLDAFMEADLDMHLRIAQEAGNRFTKMVLSCIKPLGKRFGHVNYSSGNFSRQTLDEHIKLLNAIRSGDEQTAAQIMKAHLESSQRMFKKHLS